MATNAEVLEGIQTALSAGCPGLKVYRVPPQDVVAPAVLVTGFSFEPHIQFGADARKFDVELTVVVSARQVQFFDELLRLVEPSDSRSVQTALEADGTLGGRVSDVRCSSVDGLRELTIGESGYWAMTIGVEVWG
jgi:hypothetical protein